MEVNAEGAEYTQVRRFSPPPLSVPPPCLRVSVVRKESKMKVRVAINGYGVIGKRVADAVRLQPDMQLVGVGDVVDVRVINVDMERGRIGLSMKGL